METSHNKLYRNDIHTRHVESLSVRTLDYLHKIWGNTYHNKLSDPKQLYTCIYAFTSWYYYFYVIKSEWILCPSNVVILHFINWILIKKYKKIIRKQTIIWYCLDTKSEEETVIYLTCITWLYSFSSIWWLAWGSGNQIKNPTNS